MKRGEISPNEAKSQISDLEVQYTQIPAPLPDKSLRSASLFPKGASVDIVDYDTIVFDTYDYLDKVVSWSLIDPICAALEIYHRKTNDPRAKALTNYIKFGTNDAIEIWLLKYGFAFEEIEWIKEHVSDVNSSRIVFKKTLKKLDRNQLKTIERYI